MQSITQKIENAVKCIKVFARVCVSFDAIVKLLLFIMSVWYISPIFSQISIALREINFFAVVGCASQGKVWIGILIATCQYTHDYTITITYDQDQTIMRFWHAHSAGGDAHHAHAPDLVVALLLGALDPDDLHRRYSHEARSAWPTRWTKQMERGSLALGSVQRQWKRNMFKHYWQQTKHDCFASCLGNSQYCSRTFVCAALMNGALGMGCTWNGRITSRPDKWTDNRLPQVQHVMGLSITDAGASVNDRDDGLL